MKLGLRWVQHIALLWAGIVIGSSFIATPAKFRVPSLNIETGLEIGRVTFRMLLAAELALLIVGVTLLVTSRQRKSLIWLVALILAIQWLVVMPFLNARTNAVISGTPADGPPWHLAYIGLEAAKITLLLIVALRRSTPENGPA